MAALSTISPYTERRTFYDSESSMEQGFAGTFDRLDEYLASL